MRVSSGCVLGVVLITGCASRTSSLLLERHALGPLSEVSEVARPIRWQLDPTTQTQEQGQVEVSVTYAPQAYLQQFFSDKNMFGGFAGLNPYYPENLVFYVKIANRGTKRIRINPAEFVLTDDHSNQYSLLNVDYVTALEEHRQPMASTARQILEDARPGYFGLSIPVGRFLAAKPQRRFALIKQSSLQAGYLYPGIVHDGLVAFWSPSRGAMTFRLLLTSIKTDFDANDLPQKALEFPFTFHVLKNS